MVGFPSGADTLSGDVDDVDGFGELAAGGGPLVGGLFQRSGS
ncbi:Uncharacterised protein [Mycobacteroides abscessus subsp. abscessus]|nr:Uncharacterised protein [Mycobacteroides abscessus subsp. abscessus]